jgi:VanZ family protein
VTSRVWLLAVIAWIGVIFFSSTSLASQWCEEAFSAVSALLFGGLRSQAFSYDLIHLLADKGFHVMLFLVLAALLWRAIPSARWKWAIILIAGLFIGSCSEFLQRFFPGRDPAVRDVLINLGGTALGLVACLMLARRTSDSLFGKAEPLTVAADD